MNVKKILAVTAVTAMIFFTFISSFRSSNIWVSYIHNFNVKKGGKFCLSQVWDREKAKFLMGIKPITSHTLVGCSNHLATGRLVARKVNIFRFLLCVMLMTKRIFHLSYFFLSSKFSIPLSLLARNDCQTRNGDCFIS